MNIHISSAGREAARRPFWKQPATWAGIAFYLLACLFVFRDFLGSGGHNLASLGGDAVKNTFSYLYQAAYGKGGIWFEGMNYPFGEHLSFADGQPLLTLPASWLQRVAHLSHPHLLLVMYSTIAFSFVVAMVYTQRILCYFGLPPAGSIVFATIIIFMSPHVVRYSGHYPLAYAAFLPLLCYWSMRYYDTNQKEFLVKLFFLFSAYAFLHLYFLAMGLLWAGAYASGALFLRHHRPGKAIWHGLGYLLATFGAFGAVEILFLLTDKVTDRPSLPYTGGYAQGGGLNLLTSSTSPLWQGAKDKGWVNHINESADGFCYLGLVPVGMLLLFGIFAATGFWKKVSRRHPRFPMQWLYITGITLLFAVTVKYFWEVPTFEKWLRLFRQFRAPERFSWIAYYVLSLLAAVVLYRLCAYWWQQQKKGYAALLGIGVTALWAFEATGPARALHRESENAVYNGRFFFSQETSWKAHLAARGYQPAYFKGILALPFVHIGSEKLWLNQNSSYGITAAFKAALEMQLPIVDVYMSRTSWSQTFEAARLAGGPYANAALLQRIAGRGALLVSCFSGYPLSPDEEALLEPAVADSLGQIDDCTLFAFWPQKFLRRQASRIAFAKQVAASLQGTDTVLSTALPYYQNHMETGLRGPTLFAGRGSAPAIKGEDAALAVLPFPQPLPAPAQYEFSAWSRFPAMGPGSNRYYIKCYEKEGKELAATEALGIYSTDNAPGMWFRVSTYFEVPAGTSRIEMFVHNTDGNSYEAMDEVLLRPAESLVISKMPDGKILVNNHLLW